MRIVLACAIVLLFLLIARVHSDEDNPPSPIPTPAKTIWIQKPLPEKQWLPLIFRPSKNTACKPGGCKNGED